MDIQVSSNFERLLFDVCDRDGASVERMMQQLQQSGGFGIPEEALAKARTCFAADRADEAETNRVMRTTLETTGEMVDPHTAVGLAVAERHRRDPSIPMVTLATAHPAKFPAAVEAATGLTPNLPSRLGDLFEREERLDDCANDLKTIEEFIRARSRVVTA